VHPGRMRATSFGRLGRFAAHYIRPSLRSQLRFLVALSKPLCEETWSVCHKLDFQFKRKRSYSSYAWADLVTSQVAQPTADHTSRLARRVAEDLARAGWRLQRALADNANEYRSHRFAQTLERLGATKTHSTPAASKPTAMSKKLHRTILEECWPPAFARSLQPRYTSLRASSTATSPPTTPTGRITNGRIPIDIIDPAHKMRAAQLPVGTSPKQPTLRPQDAAALHGALARSRSLRERRPGQAPSPGQKQPAASS
jgi:transposase InsO family protein